MNLRHTAIHALLVAAVLVPGRVSAQWITHGVPVCTSTNTQENISITGNGLGGSVLVWTDYRSVSGNIYARQLTSYGVNEWTSNGIALCTAANLQYNPKVVHDGQGYLFYVWEDFRGSSDDIYAAVTDRLGNIFTGTDGIPLCSATGAQSAPQVDADQNYGICFTTWMDSRAGNDDIYMAGYGQGPGFEGITTENNGIGLCTLTSSQTFPVVAALGDATCVVAWADFRNGNYDIYAQRVDWEGVQHWAGNGVPVCTNASAQVSPMIVSDANGGVIIAWLDYRNGNVDIYAQRLDGNGSRMWTTAGVPIRVAGDSVILPNIVTDQAIGAIIAWQDERNSGTTGPDIYAQRIDNAGNVLWTANGRPVCTAPYAQSSCKAATDGEGGVVITWQDVRALGPSDVYAQRIDLYGNEQWTTDGLLISGASANQFNPKICYDGAACVIGFEDSRLGNIDVYAQRISRYGDAGHPEPTLVSVTDVPSDAGGYLRVTWQPGEPTAVNFYQLYRSTDLLDWFLVLNASGNGSATYINDVASTADGVLNYFRVEEYTLGYDMYDSNIKSGTSLANPTGIGDTPGIPQALSLLQNSPNPFNGSTALQIGLPRDSDVKMDVFDVAGKRVVSRNLGHLGAGWGRVDFDGRDERGIPLVSGVYFYRVIANGEMTTRKMVIGR